MAEILDWAKDLLVSRGALVETEEAGALRAMLSPELARELGSSDWLSLRFAAGAGSDDDGEWLERLGRLLPPDARVIGARLRRPRPTSVADDERLEPGAFWSRSGHLARLCDRCSHGWIRSARGWLCNGNHMIIVIWCL